MAEKQREAQHEMRGIKCALWAGLVVSAAAIVRVGLWRTPAPQPAGLNPAVLNTLQAAGWSVQYRRPSASKREDLSWAQGFELSNPVQHPGARLNLVPVQARGPTSYTIETLVQPVLGPKVELAKVTKISQYELARFKPGSKSGSQTTTEATCLTGEQALAEADKMVRAKLRQEKFTTLREHLERLAGLRQTRSWDCLLVVVRRAAKADDSSIWNEVMPALINESGEGR